MLSLLFNVVGFTSNWYRLLKGGFLLEVLETASVYVKILVFPLYLPVIENRKEWNRFSFCCSNCICIVYCWNFYAVWRGQIRTSKL